MAEDRDQSGWDAGYHGQPFDPFTQNYSAYERGKETRAACFPASSLVLTPRGQRRIDEIQRGETVLSFNFQCRALRPRRVKQVVRHREQPVLSIELPDDRAPIRATGFHTILTEAGWKRIDRLTATDRIMLMCAPGIIPVKVTRIMLQRCEPVFNLTTAGEHNFIVDGVIAHNFTVLRQTRSALHDLLEAVTDERNRSEHGAYAPAR